MSTITWTPEKLERFKETVAEMQRGSMQDEFHFEGHEFYVPYAKYLIEYLEGIFNKQKP